ncbi:MAG: MFS transporter, partial [Allorhizobium sp.]
SEQLSWGNQAALDWLASVGANYDSYGLDGTAVAVKKLSGVVTQQAWLLSFMDVFMGLTVLFAILVFMVLLLKKPQGAAPEGAGH